MNLQECWDVFRPHRQHLGCRAQQAPGLMGDGPSPRRPGQGWWQGHTVTRVDSCPKLWTIYSVDKGKGRLADCGLWRIVDHAAMDGFAVLSVDGTLARPPVSSKSRARR